MKEPTNGMQSENCGKIGLSEETKMKIIVSKNKFVSFIDRLFSLVNRQLTIVFCTVAIALSSCVKYDTGVNFSSLNYGEIVEHIQLGEQLNSFSQAAVQRWIASIEQRTKQAEGKIERIDDRELKVVIPFNNTQQLVEKIDRYFNPNPTANPAQSQFSSHMQISQNNFLLIVKNHLTYNIDLRSLSLQSSDPKFSIASANFVDLNFSLQSPWGVKSIDTPGHLSGVKMGDNSQMTWQLQPGKINLIDAIFWLPNPLGIGAGFIILISGTGYYFKYLKLPNEAKSR
jgi:Protein of unknown function (DUF3153)